MTGEVHLDDGEYGQMALASGLPYTGRPKIRSPDGSGDHLLPSNRVRGMILTNLKVIWDMSDYWASTSISLSQPPFSMNSV
jgi:hypothetical protein